MGGQNHQPTNRIRLIAPSAWLSQKVGDGFSHVLRANSALENAIILGVGRLYVEELATNLGGTSEGYLKGTLEELHASLRSVDEIEVGFNILLEAAALENYRGNPLASRIGDLDLRERFSGTILLPVVNRAVWDTLSAKIESANILDTLAWERDQFCKLREPMQDLIQVIEACRSHLLAHGAWSFVEAVECNAIPIRHVYAKVFSLWNYLHATFLYSAVAMTELFYMTNGMGTLLDRHPMSGSTTVVA